MEDILTLEEVKRHIHVNYDEDDEEIKGMILTAEAYIDGCVGTAYKDPANYKSTEEYEKGRRIAALLQKRIVGDMYETRTTMISGNMKMDNIARTILDKLANVGA